MPQIEQLAATWASQLFWLALTFGIAFLVVGRGMVPKVQGTIDARDASVTADLAAADAARAQADAQEERWRGIENDARDRARSMLADARARAAAASEATLGTANDAAAQQIADAESRIAGASAAALAEIEIVAAEAAQDIVARLSGVPVTGDEARAATRAVLHG
jgi:F-type H+-transporting ATPase subunit b